VSPILSVDVEDWYQSTIDRRAELSNRFERGVHRILESLAEHHVQATFFVLGLAAAKSPHIIRMIADNGHEVQSHGYGHVDVFRMTHQEFRGDVLLAKKVIENITGQEVFGYRGPNFSIDHRSEWAFDVLVETGHRYDSTIFPRKMRRYGVSDYPLIPQVITTSRGNTLVEAPVACFSVAGIRLPVGGGGYFRVWPYRVIAHAFRQMSRQGRPGVIYLHPYEFDTEEMAHYRGAVGLKTRLAQGLGRKHTWRKLHRLLHDFQLGPYQDVLSPLLDSASGAEHEHETLS